MLRIFMPCEAFFELPSVTNGYRLRWIVDQRLYVNIESLCWPIEPSQENITEIKLARHLFLLLRQYPEKQLIQAHWQAFLFKRCEKVARQISCLLPNNSDRNLFLDLFQMGCELVDRPFDFLESFDECLPKFNYWYATLKKFSDHKIKFSLFPKVREITGLPTLGQSNLGLAARASRKLVKDALMNSRYQSNVSQYLLIWQCFQEVRKAVKLKVNKFKAERFQEIADRYNQLESYEPLKIDGNEVKNYLEHIGSAIRELLDFKSLSLDTPLDSNLESESSLKNLIADKATDLDSLSNYEMHQNIEKLKQTLIVFLNNLQPIELQQILWLRHGLNFKQREMSVVLLLDQTTLSRKLKKLYKEIFLQLVQTIEQNSNISLDCTLEAIAEIKILLDERYSEQADRFLIEILSRLESSKKELLKSIYLDRLSSSTIADRLQTNEANIARLLDEIKQEISDGLMQKLEAEMKLELLPQNESRKIFFALIETKIETNLHPILD
jgi:DNA-directed RNA polymerase specialized sigma subunit